MTGFLLLARRPFFPQCWRKITRSGENAGIVKPGNTTSEVEWDESKNRLNQRKHDVSFQEAATIFLDPLELTIDDPAHAVSEHRFISIGQSFTGRLLVVSYAEVANRIRIITAREPTRRERRVYEES